MDLRSILLQCILPSAIAALLCLQEPSMRFRLTEFNFDDFRDKIIETKLHKMAARTACRIYIENLIDMATIAFEADANPAIQVALQEVYLRTTVSQLYHHGVS